MILKYERYLQGLARDGTEGKYDEAVLMIYCKSEMPDLQNKRTK